MAGRRHIVLEQVETVDADPDVVRGLLTDPARWAPLLPHVELVDIHFQTADHTVARLSVNRLWWWPVTLLVELAERQGEIRIRHLAGAGKGVIERWMIEPAGDGPLQLRLQIVARGRLSRLRAWLIVAPLAVRTFQMVAMLAEAEQQVDRAQLDPRHLPGLPGSSNPG